MSDVLHFEQVGLLFFTSLFLSLFLVPLTVGLAQRLAAVDHPTGRSSHARAVTRLGGLGIAASMLLTILLYLPFDSFMQAFLGGVLVIVLTGFLDDVLDVSPRWKFVGQILAALLFIWGSGVSLQKLGDFFGGGEIQLDTTFAISLTVFCMVGGMNALNLADGLDGLAGGLSAIAAAFFAYLAWAAGANDLLLLCVVLLGALLGFLRYNSHPARLFMGDTGSLLLGYVLTVILVSGSQRNVEAVPLVAWVLVVALPLLDILLVMGRRILHGQSPLSPDRTHLHHRLLLLQLPHSAVVGVMYIAMALFGWLAVSLLGFPDWVMFALLFVAGFLLYAIVFELQHALGRTRGGKSPAILRNLKQWLSNLRMRANNISLHTVAVSLVLLSLLCAPALFAPIVALNRGQAVAMLMLSAVVVIYCRSRDKQNLGILHGVVYVSMVVLVFIYNLSPNPQVQWVHLYVGGLSLLAVGWVTLKLLLRKNTGAFKADSFELLILFLSSFVPLVLLDEMRFSAHIVEAGRLACLQAIPLLVVVKIYFAQQPAGNRWVERTLAAALAVVALRGFFA